jgi:hypothetical protein
VASRRLRDATALPLKREAFLLNISKKFIDLGFAPDNAVEIATIIKRLHAINGAEAKIARLIEDTVDRILIENLKDKIDQERDVAASVDAAARA